MDTKGDQRRWRTVAQCCPLLLVQPILGKHRLRIASEGRRALGIGHQVLDQPVDRVAGEPHGALPNMPLAKKALVTATNSLGASIIAQCPQCGRTKPQEFSSSSRKP